jgi:hypothetical protein
MGFSEIFHNRLMADRFVLETSKGSVGILGHRRLQQWKCSGKLEEALQLLAHHLLHETPQVESGRGVRGCDLQKREKELLRRAHPPQQEHQDRATAADIEPSSRCLRSRRPACRVPAWGERFLPEGSSRNSRLIGDKAYDSDALDEKLASETASS